MNELQSCKTVLEYAHGKVIIELTGQKGHQQTTVSCEGIETDVTQSILTKLKRQFNSGDMLELSDGFSVPGNQVEAIKAELKLEKKPAKKSAQMKQVNTTSQGAVVPSSYNSTLSTSPTMTNLHI